MKTKECESVCYDQIRSDVIDERDHGQARLLLFQVEVAGALEQSESPCTKPKPGLDTRD